MVNVLFAEGFEEIEALTVVDLLRRADIEVNIVSADNKDYISGGHGITVKADVKLSDALNCDMVVLPGGIPGVPNLLNNPNVVTYLKSHYDDEKYIAAICAAPSILGELSMLSGKKATCYPSFSDKLNGGCYTDDNVTIDGKFITSKAMGTAIDFALKIIETLKDEITADKVASSIYYR